MGDFDVTLGMGWGRLAGKGDFENPMTWLSDTFLLGRQRFRDEVVSLSD